MRLQAHTGFYVAALEVRRNIVHQNEGLTNTHTDVRTVNKWKFMENRQNCMDYSIE